MDTLNSGSTLDKGNEIASKNGKYKLRMQPDGNLVLYGGTLPIWATNTQSKKAERLEMQGDGNLVVYAEGKDDVWSAKTNRNKGASLILQDDGNLVVYSKDKEPLWASNTAGKGDFSTPAAATTTPATTAATTSVATSASDKAGNAPAAPVVKPAVATNARAAATPVAATKAANKATNSRSYTVAKGDSLWKIAEKIYGSGTDYKKIAKANHISNPDHIRPGQQLVIPE